MNLVRDFFKHYKFYMKNYGEKRKSCTHKPKKKSEPLRKMLFIYMYIYRERARKGKNPPFKTWTRSIPSQPYMIDLVLI